MDKDSAAPEQAQPSEPEGREVAELLAGIPGSAERLTLAREQIERGEGIPIDEL